LIKQQTAIGEVISIFGIKLFIEKIPQLIRETIRNDSGKEVVTENSTKTKAKKTKKYAEKRSKTDFDH